MGENKPAPAKLGVVKLCACPCARCDIGAHCGDPRKECRYYQTLTPKRRRSGSS